MRRCKRSHVRSNIRLWQPPCNHVGLDDEYLESFCKAEDRTSLHSLESSKTLPRIFTAAMGAQGRRSRFHNQQKRPSEAAALALAAGQERQARPAVAAALSAIWEQGILPALHSLLQHGSDTSTPDSVRIPQRPTRFGYLNARGSTLRTTLDTGLGCHMRGYRADTRHERSPLCCPRASASCTSLGLRRVGS